MPERCALIIANSEFNDPKLSRLATPGADAESLAKVLGDPKIGDFDVSTLVNEPMQNVRREIARFYSNKKKDDLLLLYYSGHGIKDDSGNLFLAVKDTEIDLVSATAIEATFVCAQLDQYGSQRKIVILDCCHSGAFTRGAKAALGSKVGAQEVLAGNGYGRVILTASNAVEYAWERDELLGATEKSVFTHFIVEGLRTGAADVDQDGEISLDELYEYVYEQVVKNAKSKQTPQKWTQKVEGQIVIARSPAPKVLIPVWIREALISKAVSARLAAVSGLAQLSHGEDQILAAAARIELERLSQDDEDPTVRDAASGALGITPAKTTYKPLSTSPPSIKTGQTETRPALELHPSLSIKLSVKSNNVKVGSEVKWKVVLFNDGEDNLQNLLVSRNQTLLEESFNLTVGKERILTFTTTYVTIGKKTEKVKVTGIGSNGAIVRTEASATVQVRESHEKNSVIKKQQDLDAKVSTPSIAINRDSVHGKVGATAQAGQPREKNKDAVKSYSRDVLVSALDIATNRERLRKKVDTPTQSEKDKTAIEPRRPDVREKLTTANKDESSTIWDLLLALLYSPFLVAGSMIFLFGSAVIACLPFLLVFYVAGIEYDKLGETAKGTFGVLILLLTIVVMGFFVSLWEKMKEKLKQFFLRSKQ